jgi:hypothetical protein
MNLLKINAAELIAYLNDPEGHGLEDVDVLYGHTFVLTDFRASEDEFTVFFDIEHGHYVPGHSITIHKDGTVKIRFDEPFDGGGEDEEALVIVQGYLKHLEEKPMLYYIKNGFVGNAISWWAVDGKGYTTDITKAGKYSEDEARSICRRPEDTAWPVGYVDGNEKAHKMIIDGQYLDPSNKLQ